MDLVSGWCRSERRLDGRTAVVTGSNSGIGKETARDFYIRGARVIMACRDTAKAEAAKKDIEEAERQSTSDKGILIVEELDLSRLSSVRAFASKILAREEGISILVNNAGVMMCPEGRTEDGFETHMGTNHYGHALLTLLLLPLMKRNGPSRVVFVSSYLHRQHLLDLEDLNFEKSKYDALKAYCRSKAANVLFARALANKVKEHNKQRRVNLCNVTTYSLHPGVIHTEIGRHFSESYYGATWAFNHLMSWFVKSPRCGAQTSIYCAVDEKCASESGLYYRDCGLSTASKQCQDDRLAAEFWTRTLEDLKLSNFDPFGDSLDLGL